MVVYPILPPGRGLKRVHLTYPSELHATELYESHHFNTHIYSELKGRTKGRGRNKHLLLPPERSTHMGQKCPEQRAR
jgi:hypothetical protein